MKSSFLAFLLLCVICSPVFSQSALISTTVTPVRSHPPMLGRDFWFAVPSNLWGVAQTGTYIEVNITSPTNTTAHLEFAGQSISLSIQAFKVTSYKLPESIEMESSGIPESKAIHVYSNDADLSVTFMSHQPFSSEGTSVIPGIGWGTDYVVAASGSFYRHDINDTLDLPSECVVVANEDNTEVSITPSCNCRQAQSGNIFGGPGDSLVVYDAGQTYSWTLNRGESLLLMPVKAGDLNNFDMTGTIIHASQPVGVIGAAMYAEIPNGYGYPDFVCEMLPPVRTWGETYYAINWAQPPGSPDDFTQFLFIASQPNQTIWRYNMTTGAQVECVINNQYGVYWDELEQGQKFYSNQPFLVVAYMNSADYPGVTLGNGDPAEAVVPAREQFQDTVVFQMPPSVNDIVPYTNYANIIVNKLDDKYTYYDGRQILGLPSQQIDDTFEIFVKSLLAPGPHVIENRSWSMTGHPSHGGVGVYYYGYGFDESYAATPLSMFGTFHSPDTIPPKAIITNDCFSTFVHLADSGLLPDGIHAQSGLAMIRLDSDYNMNYQPDVPNFIEGSGADTSGYGIIPIDASKAGYLRVEVFDLAGNETIITSIYKPLIDSIFPPLNNLGVALPGVTNYGYDTIFNDGQDTIHFTSISLKLGNEGFRIDSASLSPLAPGTPGHPTFRVIKLSFEALKTTKAVDSVLVLTSCNEIMGAVIGSGGFQDLVVTSEHWNNVLLTQPATCYKGYVLFQNLSGGNLTIDSVYWPDKHFTAISALPVTIPPSPAHDTFWVQYCPDSGSLTIPNRTQGAWYSNQIAGARFDSLVGNALAPAETFGSNIDTTITCDNAGETITLNFTIAATGTYGSVINRIYESDTTDFQNLIGTVNATGQEWDPTSMAQALPSGQSATISVQFTGSQSAVDLLTAVDGNGDTIATVRASVNIVGTAATLTPDSLSFSGNSTQSFQIQNATATPLAIDYVIFDPGDSINGSFTLTTSPAYPDTLAQGQSMTVTIHFNNSFSSTTFLSTVVDIASPNCTRLSVPITAKGTGSSVALQNTSPFEAFVTPIDDGHSFSVELPEFVSQLPFELRNVLGERIMESQLGREFQTFDASVLPRGVYFWRIMGENASTQGKIILGE